MRAVLFVLKLGLKILAAPVVLALMLFTWVCFGLLYVSSFIFGLAENLSYLLQSTAIPSQIILMAPYVCTILALIFRNFNLKKSLSAASGKRLVKPAKSGAAETK